MGRTSARRESKKDDGRKTGSGTAARSGAKDVRDFLNQFAKSLGLDVERFKIEMDGEGLKTRIIAEQQRAASLGADRTPAIFINDHRVPDSSLSFESDRA